MATRNAAPHHRRSLTMRALAVRTDGLRGHSTWRHKQLGSPPRVRATGNAMSIQTISSLAGLVLWIGGCVEHDSTPRLETPGPANGARVSVRLEFEPPLAAPGQLRVAHECGEHLVVTTTCTGVDLMLRPGPVVFVLLGDRSHEHAASIAAGMPAIVWPLGVGSR